MSNNRIRNLIKVFHDFPSLLGKQRKLATNPHFWLVLGVTVLIAFIYQAWPWRPWNFTDGVWRWFPWLSHLFNLALFEVQYNIVGSLFLIPIIYSIIVLPWRYALIVSVLAGAIIIPVMVQVWPTNITVGNIIVFLAPILLTTIFNFERQWRNREKRIFIEREAERQAFISRILESQEQERSHVANELHDDTIQAMLFIANQAQRLIESIEHSCDESTQSPDLIKRAETIRDALLEAVDDLRRLSLSLSPNMLKNLGLKSALRWLVDSIEKQSGISIELEAKGVDRTLDHQYEVMVFRVIQEALNNIKKHSGADHAHIVLDFSLDEVFITVEDNGHGFVPPKSYQGFATFGKMGLASMRERTRYLNGRFEINSSPGQGTKIKIKARC